MKKYLLALLMTFNTPACFGSGFFPENHWQIPEDASFRSDITEEEFNEVIDEVKDIYSPRIARHLGKLTVSRQWKNATVNAYAMRIGPVYLVTMFGGLARHPSITRDGLSLVMCHEVGHHIGGAPKGGIGRGWSSVEGQSDYFASLKCLREVFKNSDNILMIEKMKVPSLVKNSCDDVYKTAGESAMCQRIAMAGLSVSNLFADLKKENPASFDTPDQRVVEETYNRHPHFQCRLDTFFQGALCDRPLEEKLSKKNVSQGTCHAKNGDTWGLRPRCWFAAQQ